MRDLMEKMEAVKPAWEIKSAAEFRCVCDWTASKGHGPIDRLVLAWSRVVMFMCSSVHLI
jgi:hypothetical protein